MSYDGNYLVTKPTGTETLEVDDGGFFGGFVQPKPTAHLKWLAVDLDGTLAETVYDCDDPETWDKIGEPIWRNVSKLLKAHQAGWKIIIHTSRPWWAYEAIEAWYKHWGIPISRIVCGKLLAHRYIDDRNVSPDAEAWV